MPGGPHPGKGGVKAFQQGVAPAKAEKPERQALSWEALSLLSPSVPGGEGGGGMREGLEACGWATGWRRTGECIFFSVFTRSSKTRRTRQVLGDSSFHCQRMYFLFGFSVCCWRFRSPAQADQGSPAACKHGERSKINKPKVSRPKANQRIFFFFLLLLGSEKIGL